MRMAMLVSGLGGLLWATTALAADPMVTTDDLLKNATRRLGGGGGGNAAIAQGGVDVPPTRESLLEVLTETVPG